jgi:membrane-bound lytic murein transglycosylase B
MNGEGHGAFADDNPLPRHALEDLARAGVKPRGRPLPTGTRAALLELRSPDRPAEYRLGLQNFYVLTRYNRSVFYAMAVSDLADALRASRVRPKPAAS